MTIWESGRESGLLDDIIAGRKTIEGRLKRGKFAEYRVDDVIKLRRDIRDESGVLHDGEPDQARVKIVGIREYSDFLSMCQSEGYERVIPHARSAEEAAEEYNRYYPTEAQMKWGVLAIEITLLESNVSWDNAYLNGASFKQLSDADVAQLAGYLPSDTPRSALDIGCGAGELVRQLRNLGFTATGVDPSTAAIDMARRADSESKYLVGELGVISGTYGIITCKLVYAFIEDKERFLEEVRRCLDPKGFFIVLAPTHDRPINHKKGIHVDREAMYTQLRRHFRILHKQETKLGVLVICRHRRTRRSP